MIHRVLFLKIISCLLILFALPSYGNKIFKAPYVNFKIKKSWTCKSFGVDWVCHHYINKKAKPALALITAKEGLSSDNIDMYLSSFSKSSSKEGLDSKILYTKKILINHHPWIDSFRKNSISKNVFSRYIVTVCCDNINAKIHILIGFHAHQNNYTKYSDEFLKAIKTLTLSKNLKQTLSRIRAQTDQHKKEKLSYIQKLFLESDAEKDIHIQTNKKLEDYLLWLILILLFAFTSIYLFYYYKDKKKNRRRQKRQIYKSKNKK